MKRVDRKRLLTSFEDREGLFVEVEQESDRSTALLCATYLDEGLRRVLLNFFVESAGEQANELLSPEQALGTFGARIKLGYCLGLLNDEEYSALEVIRDIRNAFAHQLHGLSFTDNRIKDQCAKLKIPEKLLLPDDFDGRSTPRWMFIFTASIISSALADRAITIQRERRLPAQAYIEYEA